MTATNQPIKISRFDVASYLTDEATIQAYLNEMLESGTPANLCKLLTMLLEQRAWMT